MKRHATGPLSLLGAALLCGLCAGCTERQLITHPEQEMDSVADGNLDDGDSATTFANTEGDADGGSANLGNFPEPAITECGNLPPGVDPIPSLSTAWAVSGHAPGRDAEGESFPDDLIRLRFSDYGAGCDEAFTGIEESCVDAWTFAFSLAGQSLTPGIYELSALPNLYPEIYASTTFDGECVGGEVGGGGAAPGAEPQGVLEIFSVTGGCVVGEFRDVYDGLGDLDIDRNGGFVAMRCESSCVPMPFNDCGQ